MAAKYLASIDQSTTSTKFSIFTQDGKQIHKVVLEHRQISLGEGMLEHDPIQISNNVLKTMEQAVAQMLQQQPDFKASQIMGLGICNQRQTLLCWDEKGVPLHHAIVWCDSRTKSICDRLKDKYSHFKQVTGLPVSTYFSLFKLIWLKENIPNLAVALQQGTVKVGTIDSWVVYNLTGGKHVIDASNASRTFMCSLNATWSQDILSTFGISQKCLPLIVDSFAYVGNVTIGPLQGIPICSILGDQQSSAYAHGLKINQVKITYGTGCFLLANIGPSIKVHPNFVTTILYKHGAHIQYGYEASVECGGGILNWAKRTGLITSYDELNQLEPLKDEQLFFFPSFGAIYAPFWRDDATGGFWGLSFSTTRSQLQAAIMESIVFRLYDNIREQAFGQVKMIVADGGMTVNAKFMQMQADLFQKRIVVRQRDTCWGVAKGVLTCLGLNASPQTQTKEGSSILFTPKQNELILARYNNWRNKRRQLIGY